MKNLASPWKRLVAYVIDCLLSFSLGLYIFSLVAGSYEIPVIMNNLLILIIYLVIGGTCWKFVNIIFTIKLGGSVGKLVTGIAITTHEGKYISFWRAVLRNYIGYYVSSIVLWLGFIWTWKDPEHRGWHDMIADTYVVEKNKSGVLMGVVVLVITIIACLYFVFSITRLASKNIKMYKDIYTDIKTELKPTPTPVPPPFVPPPNL
jgi:uncharacterized RDD family membrane protein YckC